MRMPKVSLFSPQRSLPPSPSPSLSLPLSPFLTHLHTFVSISSPLLLPVSLPPSHFSPHSFPFLLPTSFPFPGKNDSMCGVHESNGSSFPFLFKDADDDHDTNSTALENMCALSLFQNESFFFSPTVLVPVSWWSCFAPFFHQVLFFFFLPSLHSSCLPNDFFSLFQLFRSLSSSSFFSFPSLSIPIVSLSNRLIHATASFGGWKE